MCKLGALVARKLLLYNNNIFILRFVFSVIVAVTSGFEVCRWRPEPHCFKGWVSAERKQRTDVVFCTRCTHHDQRSAPIWTFRIHTQDPFGQTIGNHLYMCLCLCHGGCARAQCGDFSSQPLQGVCSPLQVGVARSSWRVPNSRIFANCASVVQFQKLFLLVVVTTGRQEGEKRCFGSGEFARGFNSWRVEPSVTFTLAILFHFLMKRGRILRRSTLLITE